MILQGLRTFKEGDVKLIKLLQINFTMFALLSV